MAKQAREFKNTGKINSGTAATFQQKGPSFWQRNRRVAIVFGLLGFLLYSYSLNCEYVLDDQIVYTDNKFVQQGFGGIKDILGKETFVGYFGEQKDLITGARYRPLSLITFAVEHNFFKQPQYADDERTKLKKNKHGQDLYLAPPAVGHFNNIIMYILSTLLLFRVLSMLFPTEEDKPWYFTVPFLVSLLFLLHPIHTEAVANIKGRDEILAFIGSFAAMFYVLKWRENGSSGNLLAAATSFFFGLLAKENAITFLAVIPITQYVFFSREDNLRGLLKPLYVLLGVFVLYLGIRYRVIGYFFGTGKEITDILNNPFYGMTWSERMATVFYTLGLYIKLLFYPLHLAHDYYPYQIPKMNWSMWPSIVSLLGYVAMGVFAIAGLLRKNIFAYCAAFYLATLSIVSNVFFSVGTFMNERFVYLSSVGFCLMIGYFLVKVLPSWLPSGQKKLNLVSVVLLSLLAIGYGARTVMRVPDWKSALSLNTSAIKVSPNSARANLFMGTALFNKCKGLPKQDSTRKEDMYKARWYVQKAVSIVPNYYSAIHMLSGLDAEIYGYDNNLDTLLSRFKSYMPYRNELNIEDVKTGAVFMDLYLQYLNSPVKAAAMVPFYKSIIPIFTEKKDYKNAQRYLSMALQIAPQDPWFNEHMAKIQPELGKQSTKGGSLPLGKPGS
jgi:hypothetical protein